MKRERLEAARKAIAELNSQLADIDAKARDLAQAAAPAERAASNLQSMKQHKRGLLARMLSMGKVDTAAPEITSLDAKIAEAESAAGHAEDVMAARQQIEAELRQMTVGLHAQRPALMREVAEARMEAVAAEINQEAIPGLMSACDALREAYGRLAGLGVAHQELGQELFETYGVAAKGIGSMYPIRQFNIIALGFGLASRGGINNVCIDASELINQVRDETLASVRAF